MSNLVSPVKPKHMELVFFYECPFCRSEVLTAANTVPGMIMCERCGQRFPIVPVDGYTVNFIKTILDDGKAAIDPDFL